MSNSRKHKLVIDQEKPSCSSNYKPSSDKRKRDVRQLVEEGGQSENDQIHKKAIKLDSTGDHELNTSKFIDSESDESSTPDSMIEGNKIIVIMDNREPLITLRCLLEEELDQNLEDYTFFLRNSERLDDDKNLVKQCVQEEGLVEITCELQLSVTQGKIINITDIVKADEEILGKIDTSKFIDSESEESSTPDTMIKFKSMYSHDDFSPAAVDDNEDISNIKKLSALPSEKTKSNSAFQKVPEKKFVYRFDINLKIINRFSTTELQVGDIGAEKKIKNLSMDCKLSPVWHNVC